MLRKLRQFDYFKPSTLPEALALLSSYDGEAKILAGGTDLLVGMKEKELSPRCIIDIKGISGLNYINYHPKQGLTIGALTTIRTVENSPLVRKNYPFLSHAAGLLGCVQVRNKATIGGNLCNAAPSAETAPSLLCLDAKVKIASLKGERVIFLEEFFRGPGLTALDKEILVEIQLSPYRKKGIYIKHSPRKAMDVAIVGVAVAVTEDKEKEKWEDVRIALGAVAPIPLRVRRAEEILAGRKLEFELIERAVEIAKETASPISDVRASAEYRREMVSVLVQRALEHLSG
jgi:carbon-monoxide dehydrogenase medium subunit